MDPTRTHLIEALKDGFVPPMRLTCDRGATDPWAPIVTAHHLPVANGFLEEQCGAKNSFFLARDGFLSMLLYFLAHPEPTRTSARLLIPHALAGIVPEAWHPQVAFFRYHFRRSETHLRSPKKILFIKGLLRAPCFSLEYLDACLKEIKSQLSDWREIIALFPPRHGAFMDEEYQKTAFSFEVVRRMERALGKKVQFQDWQEDFINVRFGGSFLDLNEGLFAYGDDYTSIFLASRGYEPLLAGKAVFENGDSEYRLSRHVYLQVTPKLPENTGDWFPSLSGLRRELDVREWRDVFPSGFGKLAMRFARKNVLESLWTKESLH